jgi:DNA-binding XRE family transcriptional regulator
MRTLPAPAADYLSAHPRATPAQLAAALGITMLTARSYRARAIRAGIAKPLRPRLDLDEMRELIEDGARTEDAARHLGISRNALICRLYRADTPLSVVRADTVYSAADLARIIGVAAPTAREWLRRWREQRLIRCRIGRRHGSPWRIAVLDWMAFLERPNCPLDPARIADAEWREYAAEWRERRARETR